MYFDERVRIRDVYADECVRNCYGVNECGLRAKRAAFGRMKSSFLRGAGPRNNR
ncbi:MAG: hypothetical protein IPK82_10840 [Polyangiaceae bacterium]|nr:hypothetical protein [Polyangiaceae bacterium]